MMAVIIYIGGYVLMGFMALILWRIIDPENYEAFVPIVFVWWPIFLIFAVASGLILFISEFAKRVADDIYSGTGKGREG